MSTQKVVYFNRMEIGTKETKYLPEVMANIYDLFTKKMFKQIPELILNDNRLYLSGIRRIDLGIDIDTSGKTAIGIQQYAYAINISCVNPNEKIKYGNLKKQIDEREKILNTADIKEIEEEDISAEDIGPLNDTQVVVDPNRRIIGTCRGRGRLNSWYLKKFLKNLLSLKALSLSVILNSQGIADIKNLGVTKEITYSIASPDHFMKYRKTNRSEVFDMRFASYFKSSNMKVTLSSPGMNKKHIIKKAELLSAEEGTKNVKIVGINDGVEKTVDLIRNKLTYLGDWNPKNPVENEDYINFLNYAYMQVFNFIKETFNADKRIIIK
ncbi:hypothetical protein IMAU80824_00777 [Lactiplantibacillus plantarum]|nr:hypothetical protein [Lactiplantibacillus plantarum]